MPFTKVGRNKYRSPSGRILTRAQIRAYYAKKHAKRRRRHHDAAPIVRIGAIDLPEMVARQPGRRRTITFRAVQPASTSERELFSIVFQVVRTWAEMARDRILPAYEASVKQAEPMIIDTFADDIDDLAGEIDKSDETVQRLILRLDRRLRDWTVRAERIHRSRFTAAAKVATGVDLSTILTVNGVEETVASVFQRNISLIRNVSDATRGRIADIVFREFQLRTPRRQVAKMIVEAVGLERKRALRIASDQSTKMSAALDRERQEEVGIKKFKWQHSGKVHFRPTHKARDGKIYSWEKNSLGGDLPGVAINCGCKAQAHLDLE